MSNITRNQDDSAVLSHVASNVRALRKQAGLSQQALADAAGLSRRMVVALETGDVNISLAKLSLLANALSTRFSDLVRMPSDDSVKARGAVTWRGTGARSVARLVTAAPATREVELWAWSLEPGERYVAEADPAGFREMIYVVDGTLTIEFATEARVLKSGEGTVYDSAQHYAYFNSGPALVSFIRNVAV